MATFEPIQQGDSGTGSVASAGTWNLPVNVTIGSLVVMFVTTLDLSAISSITGLGASWTVGTQVTDSGSIQYATCTAASATTAIAVTTAGGGNYIPWAAELPAGSTVAASTSASGTSSTPQLTVAATSGQLALVAGNFQNTPTSQPADPWADYNSGGWSISNFGLQLAQQIVGELQPLVVPSGGGLIIPHNYTNLQENWVFTGGSLPSPWNVVLDTTATPTAGGNYTPPNIEYTSGQVSLTGSACQLQLATTTGTVGYKGGLIGTISGGSGTTIGTPTYQLQYGRVRFWAQMPAGAPTGVWPGCWMTSINTATDRMEIDACEMNMEFPNTAWGTLHQWAPTVWTEGGYSGPVKFTQYNNIFGSSGVYHVYEVVWEPGMVTWGVDGVATGQITEAQAVADGHTWNIDSCQCYLLANIALSYAGTNAFGSDFSSFNNSALPVSMLLEQVQVYQ